MKFTCSALHGQTQPMSPSPYSWASVPLPQLVVACPLLFHCSNMLSGCTAFPTERISVWESGTNITTNFTLSNSGQVQTTIVKNNSAQEPGMLVRESIPRQIDKKFRVPKEEKGVWGSQSGDWGSGTLKEEKRTNFFSSAFLSLSQLQNSV